MVLYRVNALKAFTYNEEKIKNNSLLDIPASEFSQLKKEGKVGIIIQAFEKRETAVVSKSEQIAVMGQAVKRKNNKSI
jgi:hypothetical protein